MLCIHKQNVVHNISFAFLSLCIIRYALELIFLIVS